ncbi:MAG: hypothetical protein GFH27_549297n322 [Chloroflexi bacterium AL-W]|nr:hypothetical protein [Chloroflexi bacterium AL-N1]NOK68825.1 hypothetical protein [Chloroflexi bacterium AL-N10]NOK76809.1 hypothetical protein [Chloroflexi bacterium AL-N5]NOK82804.1 hypothetical protein [Chloroflexi bacterium AL-W]NOK90666.1 hypothetical protein [Chloroflexi bacterium AL-N15]
MFNRLSRQLAGMFIIMGLFALFIGPMTYVRAQGNQSEYKVLFKLPIDEEGVMYSPAGEEMLQWGPKALAVAPDGTFIIANTVANNLLRINQTGEIIDKIDLSELAVGVTDIETTEEGIFALDSAAPEPSVLHLTHTGDLIARYNIPFKEQFLISVTGLVLNDNDELFIEDRAQITDKLLDSTGQLAADEQGNTGIQAVDGFSVGGHTIHIPKSSVAQETKHDETILIGGNSVDIAVEQDLGGVQIVGAHSAKSFYAQVTELSNDAAGTLLVDTVLHQYSVDGQLLGLARIPLQEQFVRVDNPIALGENAAYALLTEPEYISVVQLNLYDTLPSILPVKSRQDDKTQEIQHGESGVNSCSIYRQYISQNAYSYISASKYLNVTNTDGDCAGRSKPRYIGGPGTYTGVPYDWGGNNTAADYTSAMDDGYKAGNTNTAYGKLGCSRGVDCSGLVTRAWGRSDKKYGTSTLPEISTALPDQWSLKEGDIMNDFVTHVFLIRSIDDGGANVYESTVDAGLDRVVYRYLPWGAFNGFQPNRYNNLCDP